MRQTAWRIAGLCCLLAGAGCSPLLPTPDKFLRMPEYELDYDYRATSADGVVLAGRVLTYSRELGGGLPFWVDAIKLRLQAVGGYALIKEVEVQSHGGLTGKALHFGRDEKRGTYRYWVTLFVDGDDLVVVEAGGPEDKVATYEAALEAAIAQVDP